jgi:hypothetical protein
MPERCEKLSIRGLYPVEGQPHNIRAQWTGAKRPPKQGEYFLSGAIIGAYYASKDMADAYPIARLVEVKEVKTLEIVKFL